LSDREHHHLVRFAEVKSCRTDEIAYILDEEQTIARERQLVERVADHMRVKMAALAGVDLNCRDTGRSDPIRIVRGLLVAFDDGNREAKLQIANGPDKQRRFPRTWARNQVERKNAGTAQP